MRTGAWRLLSDPPASPAWNMSLDEALLACAPLRGPTLRLYGWRPAGVSLGQGQRLPRALARCAALGVPVVRRISGGGAVVHENDLTYAVVAPLGTPELPDSLCGSYAWIRDALLAGLRASGLDVRPSDGREGADRLPLCFEGGTGFELELEGVKLVGSAQRRTAWGFLQHGSIRLGTRSPLHRSLFGRELPELPCLADVDPVDLREQIAAAFDARLGGRLVPAELADDERAHAARLLDLRRCEPLLAPSFGLSRTQVSADTAA